MRPLESAWGTVASAITAMMDAVLRVADRHIPQKWWPYIIVAELLFLVAWLWLR